jgi:Domain of unknown function (DUF4190)
MSQDTSIAGQHSGSAGQGTQNSNGLAIAGLVCGLVGLLFLPIVLGPLALIFGGIGLSKANRGAGHKGTAIAAVVLGIIDLIIMGVLMVVAAKNGGSLYFNVG